MQSIKILYDKLKTFKKDAVFGANVSNFQDAANNILLAGTPEKINDYIDKIKSKYGDIKSLVFVTVPKTNLSQYDNSLKLFSDSVKS